MYRRWLVGWILLGACTQEQPSPPQTTKVSLPVPSQTSPLPSTSTSPTTSSPEMGGLWVGCYAHFRPTSTPLQDVTRLGLLCGPANGLHPIAPAHQGTLIEGGSIDILFPLEQGQCVRAFGVSEAGLSDLDLTLLDPQGTPLGSDQIEDRWPILPPDGTLCVATSGRFQLRVTARKGSGAFAAQLWLLP